ncbi:MAG: branched-chain amino acid aminotransferase [Flavobacteriales bacterium]
MDIEFIKESKLPTTDYTKLPFGTCFIDHMFEIHYENGKWTKGMVKPYGKIEIFPSTQALHYGQVFFEGMKAYKNNQDDVLLFRPLENVKRFNRTAKRLCMPEIPEELFMDGLNTLLEVDKAWVPKGENSSLYIRPFMFASGLGVKASHSERYTIMIIACPVDAYYLKPVKLLAEMKYSRAASGGTGDVKAGGNYAGSFYPAQLAREKGYDQLMWTDADTHTLVEEAGTMNIFFRIGNKLLTPALTGTILPGITRDSIIELAKHLEMEIEVRPITLVELKEAYEKGEFIEAFGAGTAATISNICEINIEGSILNISEDTSFSTKLKENLESIKREEKEDVFGWVYRSKNHVSI